MRKISILAALAAVLAFSAPAEAARRHHQPTAHAGYQTITCFEDARVVPCRSASRSDKAPRIASQTNAQRVAAYQGRRQAVEASNSYPEPRQAFSGFSSNSLVSEARKYIGTNPTGRGSLWCGAFMDLVLKKTGHAGGGNLASAYARYGTRISGPQIGAIAVMGRRGGGHVGIVSAIDANGNPVIISGNTRMGHGPHTTLEHVYPRSRIYAYVIPK